TAFGRGQSARFRPYCMRDKRPRCQTRSAQVSERERSTTARCPECDGKQKILRSSELSEFSTSPKERHASGDSGPGLLRGRSFICWAPEQTTGTKTQIIIARVVRRIASNIAKLPELLHRT